MMINKGILHILDFSSGLSVFSQQELDFSRDEVLDYIEKHLQKAQGDAGNKPGIFYESSDCKLRLQQYLEGGTDFIGFTTFLGHKLYDTIVTSDCLDPLDVVIVQYTDNDIPYIAILLLGHKEAYTHKAESLDGVITNQLLRHLAILPGTAQKLDAYAIIRCDDFTISLQDKIGHVDGERKELLSELVLQCTAQVSPKEVIKTVTKAVKKVAEDHAANTVEALARAKSYLVENAESSDTFSPIELGREVFSDSTAMQQAFEEAVAKKELPAVVKVDKQMAVKAGRSHKIKTDTGIEVTFPAEYFENHEFIEFITNPNGTISIELKNIGKIVDK